MKTKQRNLGERGTAHEELEKALEEATFALERRPNSGEWRESMGTVREYIERALTKMETVREYIEHALTKMETDQTDEDAEILSVDHNRG